MKVGIFFGGPSREREISFAGGRTVYDNLNKSLFTPIPIFVNSFGDLVKLNWEYIYKGSIRDFYPPIDELPDTKHTFQIYEESLGLAPSSAIDKRLTSVGEPIGWNQLAEHIDFAFLALHGAFGEDGQIQGILDSLHIPYSGSGLRACAIGMDKSFQKKMMDGAGFISKPLRTINKSEWSTKVAGEWYQECKTNIGLPMVIRPANQGSSIGVSILYDDDLHAFINQVNAAFFQTVLDEGEWSSWSSSERVNFVRAMTDVRSGLGFPIVVEDQLVEHPDSLLTYIEDHFTEKKSDLLLHGYWTEQDVVVEGFINGREFSCVVVQQEGGQPTALPPTEIIKGKEVYDYRSKYLPGLSRKETPIKIDSQLIRNIRAECERLFSFLGFNVYARIDGFITEDGSIYLNDPNTTSGMLPSSFFFHQAAEIGLNPSQFLTYIIRTSLQSRLRQYLHWTSTDLLDQLDTGIKQLRTTKDQRKRVAVLFGGYSFERHISVESGRNIYEKLASSDKYVPIPIFIKGRQGVYEYFQVPINLLLKDNADDINDRIDLFIEDPSRFHHTITEEIKSLCQEIIHTYAAADVIFEPQKITLDELADFDAAFIALHGRPGEDGDIQAKLERIGLPYNGSDHSSSKITIDKFATLDLLRKNGFNTANQQLISKETWLQSPHAVVKDILANFELPLVIKPVDDGCSSAVKMIKNQVVLEKYLATLFRDEDEINKEDRVLLGLQYKEEFPRKQTALVESKIDQGEADLFMEITGGLLTHWKNDQIEYELFEPSETLSGGDVLSLEEKFLAGEGLNITPARFGQRSFQYGDVAKKVKEDLERAARLLNVKGYARIDAFVRVYASGEVETIIIEVNSLPGMTPATCIFHQTAINGYKPYDFIDKILEFGIHDQKYEVIK